MAASAAPTIVQRRIAVAALLCIAAFAVLGLRLLDVMILRGRLGGEVPAHARELASRADLTDRNGAILARDLPVHDLYAQPSALVDKRGAAHLLALASGASEQRLVRVLDSKSHFVLIERQLTPNAEARVMQLGLPGLEFTPAYKRYYPEAGSTVQVIGQTDTDGHGVSGLELGLNPVLRAGAPDKAVALSIDMPVQYTLAEEVERAREDFSARAAGGIVLNVNTGEVLAMVSLPDGINGQPADGADPRRNRMAQDDYELGSVFKIFSFALAFEDHAITPETVLPIPSAFRIGKHAIHDAEHMPSAMAAKDILAESSNVGTAQIALRSGGAKQDAFLRRLGLLQPLKSELPERAYPLYPRNWGEIETATVSFGQGISVTPLSFARAAAEVVNGGRALPITFLRHPQDARGEQLIAPETSEQMRRMLRYVATNGTGRNANIPGYDVAGKTGSAQVPGPNGRYENGKLRTSFCAIFPAQNPRYLVFVMLDEPHGTKKTFGLALAGYTAAPLAGRVIARIAPMLGMVPQLPPSGEQAQASPPETP